jgi:aldehyde dehydrogenase (NAD+)
MHDGTRFYIDGHWTTPPNERSVIDVENPATETVVGRVLQAEHEDVDRAVAAARAAFDRFSQWSREDRVALLERIITAYRAREDEMARVITEEMGASRRISVDEQVPSGLGHFEAARDALAAYAFESSTEGGSTIVHEPIGVCALITPWNWPMNQIAAKVAPAIATGCTCVLKPSEISPLSAHLFTEILDEAGVPPGVFNLVDGDGPGVGAYLAGHPDVDMVSFTGSTRAGVDVSRQAAPTVKRVTLELGGKSPNIILDDADFETAVRNGTITCMANVGQSCDAPTRMLVPNDRLDEAVRIATEAAQSLKSGDPTAEDTDNGPIAYRRQYDKVVSLIRQGIEEGAELACGGVERPAGCETGYFVQPTVFARVSNEATIAREEIFGPVLTLIGYDDEEEAIRIANDTPYGLAANVSSGDPERARRVAGRLRAGQIRINDAAGDFQTPFGGYKQSGNGREGGAIGFEDFLEIKSIVT